MDWTLRKSAVLAACTTALAAMPPWASAASGKEPLSPQSVPKPTARPTFQPDGTVNVPAFDLPASILSSPEAQAAQASRAKHPVGPPLGDGDVLTERAILAKMLSRQVQAMIDAYPVNIEETSIAGVPARVVTPKDGKYDPARVLINVHGGGFSMCWESCSILESAPIAALGKYKVVTLNYRMAPEAKHPAAVEDVEKAYRELLKSYKPSRIGLFGCSAGGALTAQSASWMPAHGLPQFGAIGIFGAGGVRFMAGDSAYIAGYIDGSFPPPPKAGEKRPDMTRGYFAGQDMKDSIIGSAFHPDRLAKFPPTLIITGTRAMDMSPAIVTNSGLIKAGVSSTLIVGEGMGHCYIYQPQLPEARDAHVATVAFFKKNLK